MLPDVLDAHASVGTTSSYSLDVDAHLACKAAGCRDGQHATVWTPYSGRGPKSCRSRAGCSAGVTGQRALDGYQLVVGELVTRLEEAQALTVVLCYRSTLDQRTLFFGLEGHVRAG